jgi:hypothetical protein
MLDAQGGISGLPTTMELGAHPGDLSSEGMSLAQRQESRRSRCRP